MAQIIPGAGSFLGGLGSGLGQGLNNLLQSKLDQLSKRNEAYNTSKALQALNPELDPQQAQQLAYAPTPLLQQYLKNIQSNQMGQQEAVLLSHLLSNINQQQPQPTISQFGETGQQAAARTPIEGGIGYQVPDQQVGNAYQVPAQQRQFSLPSEAAIRPGQALPIANFAKDIQQNVIKNQMAQQKLNLQERQYETRVGEKQQEINQRRFGKQIDSIKEATPKAQNRLKSAVSAYDILQSGALPTGPIKGGLAGWVNKVKENPALERYDQLLNEYIVDSLGDLTGQSSKYKAQLIENAKTKVTKSKEAQELFWEDVISKQTNVLNKSFALEDIMLENDNRVPKNFDTELNKRIRLYEKMPDDMPEASEFKEGAMAENGGIVWVIRNGRWAPVGKGL